MRTELWIKQNIPSFAGKRIAVSGATGGIGQALCTHLASLGAELWLLDRNSERSNALIKRLKEQFPSLVATHIRLDLSDFSSVLAVTERLMTDTPDALILNAGVYHVPRYTCDTGYDNVFQINFLSPFYMAQRLLPALRAKGGRVVAVGSIAHNYSHANFEDIEFSACRQASKVYGNAKRWLMFALFGMSEEGGISVVHPGITLTNITAHYPKWIYAIIKHPMKVIFMSPKRASLSILRGLCEECGKNEWIGPSLFDVWGLPRKKELRSCPQKEADEIACYALEMVERLTNGAKAE